MTRHRDDDVELETADHTLDAPRFSRRRIVVPDDDVHLEPDGPTDLPARPPDFDLSDITLLPVALPESTTSEEARGFLVAAVTIALLAFDLAFNLAVYGDIPFQSYITVWGVGITVVLASTILPAKQRPIGCGGAVVLALPSLYFPAAFLTTLIVSRPLGDSILGILGILTAALISLGLAAIYLISLPYVMLTLARILDPTIIEVPTVKMRVGLFFVAVVMAGAGGLLGRLHPWWLTCDDFAVAGNDAPPNCTPVVLE
ncbi:MAG: hypothetical protein H6737_12205 [Alphaproteobacteria bacterium]|nr:hypothetical protein [Alphaproteobacteria bacterium]